MLTGTEHERMLHEFEAFEERITDEGDRETARAQRRIRRDSMSVSQIRDRISTNERNLWDQQQQRQKIIDDARNVLTVARNEAQKELRRLSILMSPKDIIYPEGVKEWLHDSKWLKVYMILSPNSKPVNCIDLDIKYERIYDLVEMNKAEDYSYNSILFSKSFKTEDDAMRYFERNKDKIFVNHVKHIIGDEDSMMIDENPYEVFDRLFDFRLIFHQSYYQVYHEDTRSRTSHTYRSFKYNCSGNRNIVVTDIKKNVMKVDVVERNWKSDDCKSVYPCTLQYVGNQTIEVCGEDVQSEEGRSKTGKTCLKELQEAVWDGPMLQICVEPRDRFCVKFVQEI